MKNILFYVTCFVVITFFSLAIIFFNQRNFTLDMEIGYELLHAMYYHNPLRLIEQQQRLEVILDESLWRTHTLTSDVRQLHAYLRFQGEKVVPHIIYQGRNRIIFWLETPYIAPYRTFQIDFTRTGRLVTGIIETELFFILPSHRYLWL